MNDQLPNQSADQPVQHMKPLEFAFCRSPALPVWTPDQVVQTDQTGPLTFVHQFSMCAHTTFTLDKPDQQTPVRFQKDAKQVLAQMTNINADQIELYYHDSVSAYCTIPDDGYVLADDDLLPTRGCCYFAVFEITNPEYGADSLLSMLLRKEKEFDLLSKPEYSIEPGPWSVSSADT